MSSEESLLGDVVRVVDCEHRTAPRADITERYAYSVGTSNVRKGQLLLDAAKPVSRATFESWTRRAVPTAGDLIFSREAPMGEVGEVPATVPVCLGQRTVLLQLRDDLVDQRYLKHRLMSPGIQRWISNNAAGTTVLHLNVSDVRKIPIGVLPALEEQRRIVAVLEDHLSRLDVGRSAMRISRARLAALRVARLRSWHEHAVAAGGTPTALGDVVDTALGKMLDAKANRGQSTPYLRNVNVRWGTVDLRDVQTVPLADAEQARYSLARGDLLVCEGGEPGRCAIWQSNEPMAYQKALHRLRVRDGAVTTAPYVALMLEEFVRSGRAEGLFTGTTIKHLPQERLRSIPIPLPRLEVQHQLIEEAALFHTDVERFDATLATTQRREAGLRRALLDAAFSGQL